MALLHPSTESEDSREGVEAHELAESYVKLLREQKPIPEGSGEMHEGAVLYAETMFNSMKQLSVYGGWTQGTEQRLEIKQVHNACFGTVDGFVYNPVSRMLHVWDYKYGHMDVNPVKNWQLIAYTAGLFDYLGVNGYDDQVLTVQLGIVQPRAYTAGGPVRTWTVTGSDLRPYITSLRNAAERALSDAPKCNSGVQCRYCDARWNCEAANDAGLTLYEAASDPIPLDATPSELGLRLSLITRAVEQLNYVKSGLEAQIEALTKSGKVVPGWALKPTPGRENWTVSVEEVLAVGETAGVDLTKPAVLTPNQARKAGLSDEVISAISKRSNGLKLVQQDETLVQSIFKGK